MSELKIFKDECEQHYMGKSDRYNTNSRQNFYFNLTARFGADFVFHKVDKIRDILNREERKIRKKYHVG